MLNWGLWGYWVVAVTMYQRIVVPFLSRPAIGPIIASIDSIAPKRIV